MLAESQDKVYFDRMESSLGDKERLLNFVKPGVVLDVEAGGGDLAEAIRLQGNTVYTLDGSYQAIKHMNDNYPHVKTVEAYTGEIESIFEPETFDTIICSSILHEVYSYNSREEKMDEIESTLKSFHNLLKPGGKLLIRDGVKPDNWAQEASIKFANNKVAEDGMKFFDLYSEISPFYSSGKIAKNNAVHFDKTSLTILKGNMQSVMEFLYTYTWGWAGAERETQELYGIMTEKEYNNLLSVYGFHVSQSFQYIQQGYIDNLNHLVKIVDETGRTVAFPSSNMMIVSEKS